MEQRPVPPVYKQLVPEQDEKREREVIHYPFPSPFVPPNIVPSSTQPFHVGLHIMNRMGLSRMHLHLFFLIDGSRSLLELAQLTESSQETVYQHLLDLRQVAVIHFSETA